MKFHPNTRKPFLPVRVLKCWEHVGHRGAASNNGDILNPISQDKLLKRSLLGWVISRDPFPLKLSCDSGQTEKGILHGLCGGLKSICRARMARGTTPGERCSDEKGGNPHSTKPGKAMPNPNLPLPAVPASQGHPRVHQSSGWHEPTRGPWAHLFPPSLCGEMREAAVCSCCCRKASLGVRRRSSTGHAAPGNEYTGAWMCELSCCG